MKTFDVAIIGAGITGVCIFDKLQLSGVDSVLIEKGEDVAQKNSGVTFAHRALDLVYKAVAPAFRHLFGGESDRRQGFVPYGVGGGDAPFFHKTPQSLL